MNTSPTRQTAILLRNRFHESGQSEGNYPFEMTLEALSEWHLVDPEGGWLEPVDRVWCLRGWKPGTRFSWRKQTFSSHDDALARAREDDQIAEAFIAETRLLVTEESRDEDGLVAHYHPRVPEQRRPLLIDAMHEFASRLASAAALGGDPDWFDDAAHQFRGYSRILRNQETGLWHLGRDWGESPGTLCKGAWSRGHGWLLRGITETLRWLPSDHPSRPELRLLLQSTLESLAPLQDSEGMWHVLLHRPWSDSDPETTGTSLIAYAISRAITNGNLPPDPWMDVARRAIAGVCTRVNEEGVVHGACRGPGLLFDEGESLYLHQELPPGDVHGPPCVLYACLGAELLQGFGTRST